MQRQTKPNLRKECRQMLTRKSTLCLIAVLLLFTSGCVNETTDGAIQTFTYELWVPISVLVGGIVAGVAGWFLRGVLGNLGWGLLIGGPIAAIFFAPSLFQDRVVLDDSKLSMRTGIWGLTAVHEVQYDELKLVNIISEEVRGRRGKKSTNYYLECLRNDGTTAKVPINNAVGEAAAPHFLDRVSELGVPIQDKT